MIPRDVVDSADMMRATSTLMDEFSTRVKRKMGWKYYPFSLWWDLRFFVGLNLVSIGNRLGGWVDSDECPGCGRSMGEYTIDDDALYSQAAVSLGRERDG